MVEIYNSIQYEIFKLYLFFTKELFLKKHTLYVIHNKFKIREVLIYLHNLYFDEVFCEQLRTIDSSKYVNFKFYYIERKTYLKNIIIQMEKDNLSISKPNNTVAIKYLKSLYNIYNYYIKHVEFNYYIQKSSIFENFIIFANKKINNKNFLNISKGIFKNVSFNRRKSIMNKMPYDIKINNKNIKQLFSFFDDFKI